MLHVQHDYCSSFIQSDLCFLALPLSSCCFHYTIPDKTARKQILADRRLQSTKQPGFRFLKVPKLVGPISGATIPFIFLQRRGPKPSKFTILLFFFFFYIKSKLTDQLFKKKETDCTWTTGFSGRKVLETFKKQTPGPSCSKSAHQRSVALIGSNHASNNRPLVDKSERLTLLRLNINAT